MGYRSTPPKPTASLVNLAGIDGRVALRSFQRLGFQGEEIPQGKTASHYVQFLKKSSLAVFYLDRVGGFAESIFGQLLDEDISQPACICIAPESTPADDLHYLEQKVGFLMALCAPLHETLCDRHLLRIIQESRQVPWSLGKEQRFQNFLTDKLYPAAQHILGASLRLSPTTPFLLSRLAELHLHMGQYEKGEAVALKSLKMDPKHLHSINVMAEIRMKMGLMEDALEVMEGVIRNKKHLTARVRALNKNAVEARKGGDWQKAVKFYQDALRIWPDNPSRHLLLFNMALAYYWANDKTQAIEACKKCTECAPFGFTKHSDLWDKIIKNKN